MQAVIGARAPQLAAGLVSKLPFSYPMLFRHAASAVVPQRSAALSICFGSAGVHSTAWQVRRLSALATDHEGLIGSVAFSDMELNKTRLSGSLTSPPESREVRNTLVSKFMLAIDSSGMRENNNIIDVSLPRALSLLLTCLTGHSDTTGPP